MDEPDAYASLSKLLFEIAQGVPKAAEDEQLLVRQRRLLLDDINETIEFRVVRRQGVSRREHGLDLETDRFDIGNADPFASPLSAASRSASRRVRMVCEEGNQSRRRELAAWRRIVVIKNVSGSDPWMRERTRVCTARHGVVHGSLSRRELDGFGARTSRREIADIPAAGAVDERAEAVKSFNSAYEANPRLVSVSHCDRFAQRNELWRGASIARPQLVWAASSSAASAFSCQPISRRARGADRAH